MRCSRSDCLRLAALLLAACLAAPGGCERGARSLSLDKDLARHSFRTFLEAWEDGRSPQELQDASPPIIAADPDWEAGRKLVAWRTVPEPMDDGANLHVTAELTLSGPAGRTVERRITYVVGTEPVITIFRK